MELVNTNKLGITKGTPLEEAAMANFKGETYEVGLLPCNGRDRLAERAIGDSRSA